jgi:polar amino acid transport system substrate-binding protein
MIGMLSRRLAALVTMAVALPALAQVAVPAPGASPRIDAIKKAGVLRVGVLANAPWLVENTKGGGEAWSGPAWILANEYAKRLGVKLEAVPGEPRDQGAGAGVEPGRHLGDAAGGDARSPQSR